MVVPDVVPAGDNPKPSRRLVGVEQIHTWYCFDSQVILNAVLDLGSVLNKERVTTDVVDEVVLKAKMVDPMNGHAAVPALFF